MLARKFLVLTENDERRKAVASVAAESGELAAGPASEAELLAEIGRRAHAAVFLDADGKASPGIALCRRLRALLPSNSCALILFGSPRGRDLLVSALDAGADDFWPYPFNEPVCRAYLRAILRRVSRLGGLGEPLKIGELLVDPGQRRASARGKALGLSSKEFDLLYLLLKQRGQALSREFLMEEAWGKEYSGATRTIDFHVSQLRRKLGRWGRCIETVAGTGYRFLSPSR